MSLSDEIRELLIDLVDEVPSSTMFTRLKAEGMPRELEEAAGQMRQVFFEYLDAMVKAGLPLKLAVDTNVEVLAQVAFCVGFTMGHEHHKRGYEL